MFMIVLGVSLALAGPVRSADDSPGVIVLPFEEISANPSQGWMGQAISRSIVAELSQMRMVKPSVGDRATADAERAHAVAKAAGAEYVVVGGFQLLDPQLRITGQVIAVESGQVLGGLKATGTIRDLFGMQDSLAAQAKRIIRTAIEPPPTESTETQPPFKDQLQIEYVPVEPSGPIRIRAYEGSTLQEAVRFGGVRQAQPNAYDMPRYTNYAYGYGYAWPHPGGYYGMPLYWGYPPPITSGHWPVIPAYRYWFPGRVIINGKTPRHHHRVHHSHSSAAIQVRVTK